MGPGYRERVNGALNGVGNNGYSWSSTVSGTDGLRLNFNSMWLDPSNPNSRGYGFQVRCLQAFIGILFLILPDIRERRVSGVAQAGDGLRQRER